jgi:hypothetical protein
VTERQALRAGAVLLVAVAAVGNIGHTYDHATRLGQVTAMAWVIAILPDILLVLSVLRLVTDRRNLWGWAGVASSAGFVAWASIATAGRDHGAWIVACAPLVAAVIATGLIHERPRASDQQRASVHVAAGLRVDVDRAAATPAVELPVAGSVAVAVAPAVAAVEPRAVAATATPTPPVDHREEVFVAWLTASSTPTPWDTARLATELGVTRKAAGEQARRWSRRLERETR